jgi:heme-degrading monooxygenase HmoA
MERRSLFSVHKQRSILRRVIYVTLLSIPQPPKGESFMFTRIVETKAKAGKSYDLANAINEKTIPVLRQQSGFIDETILLSDTDPNCVLAISLWKTKEDAERYHKAQFSKITQPLSHLIDGTPVVRTFNVHTSTAHKVAAGIAA